MRGIDPTNPESMQALLDGGMFDLPALPAQDAALQRLEVALALVEGWVDEVVGQATAERMPAAAKLQEIVPPPPRRGRARRADLRHAGRPGAAPPPAARRVHPVGLAAHAAGHRGARRRVDAPAPAADAGRPRRPAGLPRGRHARRSAERRGLRRRAEEAARRRASTDRPRAPARGRPRRAARLATRPTPAQSAPARPVRRAPARPS